MPHISKSFFREYVQLDTAGKIYTYSMVELTVVDSVELMAVNSVDL
jgi:hypothetical protein